MAWKKSSPELVQRFNAALPSHPDVVRRKMFGYPASFVKGNFFAGMYEDSVVVRLPNGIKDRFPELRDAQGFDPMGRGTGLRDWYQIPPAVVETETKLAQLLASTFEEIHQLPAKFAKSKPVTAKKRVP